MDYIKMADEFITAMNQDKGKKFGDYDSLDTFRMRMRLIMEEAQECNLAAKLLDDILCSSIKTPEMEEALIKIKADLLKELCDLQYVLSGFVVAFNLKFDEAFRRVHESNMSKLGDDGKPIYREDGKILKGPNYKKPDLTDLV